MELKGESCFEKLVWIMDQLRGDGGCPWDKEQSRDSLKPYIIEEAHEVIEAMDEGDPEKLKEELGDLLFQVVFQARIAKERGEFDIGGVLDRLCQKMIRRHPHVFGDQKLNTSKEVLANWEETKLLEKGEADEKSIMEGVPKSLPSLLRAHRIQDKASRVGFDWPSAQDVLKKVEEEVAELKGALSGGAKENAAREIGDLLFAIANLARLLKINPEDALQRTTDRFMKRFNYIEEAFKKKGKDLKGSTLEEMDALWEEAKRLE